MVQILVSDILALEPSESYDLDFFYSYNNHNLT